MKLTLATILYNESAHIERMINSVYKITNHFIFGIDNKTDDGTEDVVRKVMLFKRMGFEIYYFDLVDDNGILNFAAARNQGLGMVNDGYILHLDGDEYMEQASVTMLSKMKPTIIKKGADVVTFKNFIHNKTGGHLITQPRMFRHTLRFKYRVHETIEYNPNCKAIMSDVTIHQEKLVSPNKNKKDGYTKALKMDCDEFPTDELPNFNLANELFSLEKHEEALKYYTRAMLAKFPANKYISLFRSAQAQIALGKVGLGVDYLNRCKQTNSKRAEHNILLGALHLDAGRLLDALKEITIGTSKEMRDDELILVDFYTWMPLFYIAAVGREFEKLFRTRFPDKAKLLEDVK